MPLLGQRVGHLVEPVERDLCLDRRFSLLERANSDRNDGSVAHPVRSIAAAVALQKGAGGEILATTGLFDGPIALTPDTILRGGYSADFSTASPLGDKVWNSDARAADGYATIARVLSNTGGRLSIVGNAGNGDTTLENIVVIGPDRGSGPRPALEKGSPDQRSNNYCGVGAAGGKVEFYQTARPCPSCVPLGTYTCDGGEGYSGASVSVTPGTGETYTIPGGSGGKPGFSLCGDRHKNPGDNAGAGTGGMVGKPGVAGTSGIASIAEVERAGGALVWTARPGGAGGTGGWGTAAAGTCTPIGLLGATIHISSDRPVGQAAAATVATSVPSVADHSASCWKRVPRKWTGPSTSSTERAAAVPLAATARKAPESRKVRAVAEPAGTAATPDSPGKQAPARNSRCESDRETGRVASRVASD
ncbi:hypothetical protein HNP73_003142 [Amaricoccus macauensis]|uniref:DUF1565 domain-containing protein n=1 Tax=Amaricoccus macauensis TaxID=57001 RepID=A0A840SRK4_9RHOB|nr:hypothetical protein [Amaricoccus macauensis]MBB5223195.1 hypothetical protein [Amaricoccus macauensis]